MGKMYFYYGAMGAGKTSLAVDKAKEFKMKGKHVLVYLPDEVWKPRIETRNNLSVDVMEFPWKDYSDWQELEERFKDLPDKMVIIVDEAQFLQESWVKVLKRLSVEKDALVFCFGLLTDFRQKMFQGSTAVIEMADSIREIPSMCNLCDKKAQFNYRTTNETEILVPEKNKYIPLCSKCYEKVREEYKHTTL